MGYTYINVTSCFAVSVSLLALSILAVSLRVFIRWRTQIKPGHTFWQTHLDDVLCVLALIPCIGTTVALIYGKINNMYAARLVLADHFHRHEEKDYWEP
jgi:hypothetical protein